MQNALQEVPDFIGNLDLDEIRIEIERTKAIKQEAEDYIDRLKAEVLSRYETQLDDALKAKDEPFGTVKIDNVKFNVPKKVEWDQDKLKAIHDDIASNGSDPAEYMTVKFGVKEAAFKNWPKAIQDEFIDARTVKPGATTVEILDGGENE